MSVPTELSDVLGGSLEGVTRIVLRHERCRAFRWLSLLELPIKLVIIAVGLLCLALIFVLALVLDDGPSDLFPDLDGDADGDGDGCGCLSPRVRFFHYWQELVFSARDAQGQVLHEVRHRPRDRAEGEGILAAVLAAADRACVVVVETLGGAAAETLEVWYGGQPLLAHPEAREPEQVGSQLRAQGFQLREEEGLAELVLPDPPMSRLRAFFASGLQLLLAPVLFWSAPFRRSFQDSLWDLRGLPPERWVLTLHADRRIETRRERQGRVDPLLSLDGRDLLGVAYSQYLDYDRKVTRQPADVRLITRQGSHTLDTRLRRVSERPLRDWIIIQALRLWAGIPQTSLRPTHCPYCGSLYAFQPGARCPSCGAPPGIS